MFHPCSEKKALISFEVTAKQVCVFVLAYAKCWFFLMTWLSLCFYKDFFSDGLPADKVEYGICVVGFNVKFHMVESRFLVMG